MSVGHNKWLHTAQNMSRQWEMLKSAKPPTINGSLDGIETYGLETVNWASYRSWRVTEGLHTAQELHNTLCDYRPVVDNVSLFCYVG
jgi:hypothetical protein